MAKPVPTLIHAMLRAGLSRWAGTLEPGPRAAVELLLSHRRWLLDADFVKYCIHMEGVDEPRIHFSVARMFTIERWQETATVDADLVILNYAVKLAMDDLGFSHLGRREREMVEAATKTALA